VAASASLIHESRTGLAPVFDGGQVPCWSCPLGASSIAEIDLAESPVKIGNGVG